jgi:hypothetical protein
VAIDDVDTKGSPGWWLKRLGQQQRDRSRDLKKLHDRYVSEPPLPEAGEKARDAYRAFQKLARTNYEELVTRAVLDRQTPVGFRTAADGDEGGDSAAAAIWRANLMPIQAADILEHKLTMREGYAIVGPPDDESDGQAVITAEDPREVIAASDPVRPWITRAAIKAYHDPDEELDIAYVYIKGQRGGRATVHRATRRAKSTTLAAERPLALRAWSWDDDAGGVTGRTLPTTRCPVVRFPNRGGLAEWEKHQDLIDRIRFGILQRMVLVVMQAFRQRALKGMPSHYPDDWPVKEMRGKAIDYSGLQDVFTSDPAAIWLLPPMAELWESQPTELTGVLAASKDDVRELATVSQSPLYLFMPDGANQTAEGASVQREGINFKVEDHNTRDGIAFAQVMSLAFEMTGDKQRAKLGQLETLWLPVERHSLAVKADASQKAKDSLSTRRILTDIWQLTPADADEEIRRREADAFLALATAPQPPAAQPPLAIRSTRADQPPANDAAATG